MGQGNVPIGDQPTAVGVYVLLKGIEGKEGWEHEKTRERWRADCIEQYPVSLLFSFSPLLFLSQITTSSDGLYVYYWFVVERQTLSLSLPTSPFLCIIYLTSSPV
jgi:hypothetical protein